jgi:hypothetical protein
MNTIIEEIRERMAKYPQLRVEHDASSITYFLSAEDGFIVRLSVEQLPGWERYTVYYNGSHEEFTHRGAAIKAFAFGLSTGCRLREYLSSGRPYRWVVDAWSPQRHRWESDWDIIRWFLAPALFWRRPTVRHLQNRLIDLDDGDSVHAAEQTGSS